MIKVTIELVSAINPKNSKILGIAKICNDGETSLQTQGRKGTYNFSLSKWSPKLDEIWKRGSVVGFDRTKRGSWDLLYLCLKNVLGERNAK